MAWKCATINIIIKQRGTSHAISAIPKMQKLTIFTAGSNS